METSTAIAPARKGFFRRLLTWRGALFVLAAFVTLVALFLAEENWRGRRAWQNYKREMEAKGESFDPARLIPPKCPDDQNLAAIPFLATSNTDHGPMTGLENQFEWPNKPPHPASWRYGFAGEMIGWAQAFKGPSADPAQAAATVLDYLDKREPVLAELASARQRPHCRFNIPYEDWSREVVAEASFHQFARVKQLQRMLSLRAQAELVAGRTDQALDDIDLMFRIDDGLRDEPLLISQLVRWANFSVLLWPVGEGLAEHRWSDAQLQDLQSHLQKANLLEATVRSFYGERDICANQILDDGGYYPHYLPRGWARLEQLNVNLAFQDWVLPRINLAAREISPAANHSLDTAFNEVTSASMFRLFLRHAIIARTAAPSYTHVPQKVAFAQNEADLAMLGCALERYRLAEGRYPAELNALVPRFVATLPHDIINGQPLKYRLTGDGRFILYSVGWNEKDDGGVVALDKNKHQDTLQGDWVWQYPAGN